MSICKISDIKDRIGTVIPSISGTIVSVFPAKEGKGQHGAWKLQNIKIKDEGGECSVTLSGLEESLQEFHKGKTIEFESVGTKFGLKGVSCEKRDYVDKKGNNVSSIGVKVTKTAKIRLEGAGMVQEDAKDDIPMDDKDFLTPSQVGQIVKNEEASKRVTSKHGTNSDTRQFESPSKTPQERIAQFGKLYAICLDAACQIKTGDESPLSITDIKDISSCLFISAMKEGLADKMDINQPF